MSHHLYPMRAKSLQTLEFTRVRERLAEYTAFSASRELALALEPAWDLDEVTRRVRATTEARRLLDLRPGLSIGGARDVRPAVDLARRGGVLTPEAYLEIMLTLASARSLKASVLRQRDTCPTLADIAEWIEERPELERVIAQTVDDRGRVRDSASPALARIRSEIEVTHNRLLERLTAIMTTPRVRAVLQEPLITIRDGRYCLPVKADFKGQLQGLIHDQSASGATVFVEPLATVELGNQWRKLQLDEEQEVERILRALSARIAAEDEAIITCVEGLAELDLAFAKARYAAAIRATEPGLVTLRTPLKDEVPDPLYLKNARHPLLPEPVVPITVRLGGEFFILVLTGPNTGGKTVSLKTIGLLALMAQAGLHIPAEEDSRLPVFNGIYADIGDEQSIEQSLSTFSSHLSKIVAFLQVADAGSLVLLDELGAGTDPVEGAALAQAILSYLRARHIPTVVATHYAELKAYACVTPGVQNASVEFDVETLSPTYRLSIGLPGRSNALLIAARLGLDETIIAEARQRMGPEALQVEALLSGIQDEHEQAQADRQAAAQARQEAEALRQELAAERARIDRERREVLRAARAGFEAQIAEARQRLRRLKADLSRMPATRDWLQQAERELSLIEAALPPPPPPASWPHGALTVGQRVWVQTLNQWGTLQSLPEQGSSEAEVWVGNFKVRVPLADLEARPEASLPAPAREEERRRGWDSDVSVPRPSLAPGTQLDLRGQRAEEATYLLDRYLDDAFRAGLAQVRIVHGKGTGVLRQVVRDHLADHPQVQRFRPGETHEGGDGVTVVQLASQGAV